MFGNKSSSWSMVFRQKFFSIFVELVNIEFVELVKITLFHFLFGTPGRGRKGPMNLGPSFRLSVCPSVRPTIFLELTHCFFLKLYMVLGTRMLGMCVTDPGFFWNNCHQGKIIKNGSYTDFFYFLGISSHQFCLEMVQNETAYGPLTFWENHMPHIMAKNALSQ